LIDIILPGNISAFFSFFTSISRFDLIPFDKLVVSIFKIDKDEGAYTELLGRMDYNYKTAFANMSTVFCFMVALAFGMILHFIVSKCAG